MHEGTHWRDEPNGLLAAEVAGLRLIVRNPAESDGFARFMVLRRVPCRNNDLFALVASGTAESVREAMGAAERRAASCEPDRRPSAPRPLPARSGSATARAN